MVRALSEVLPQQAAGASYGDSMVIGFSGVDHRNGQPFFDLEPTVGGWGAWEGSDGEDGLINNVNGSLKDLAIEVLETKFPIRMTEYAFRADTGGAGRWRGGNGVIREYTLDADAAELSLWFERSLTPAWGLFGGRDAMPPDVVINPGREDERHMLKASRVQLRRGDVVRTMTGGGGGFGDPAERDPEAVRADVRHRHVSADRRARRLWHGGRAMSTTLERTTVDARVERLRAAAEEAGLDAVLATNDASIAYLTGFSGMQLERLFAVAVPVAGGGALVVPRLEEDAAAAAPSGLGRIVYDPSSDGMPELVDALGGAGRVGVEEDHLVFGRAEALRAAGCVPQPAGAVVMGLRARKDAREVELMRKTCQVVTEVMEQMFAGARARRGRADRQRTRRPPAERARGHRRASADPVRAERGQPTRSPGRASVAARGRGLRGYFGADRRVLGRPDALRHRRRALRLGADGLGDGAGRPGGSDRRHEDRGPGPRGGRRSAAHRRGPAAARSVPARGRPRDRERSP